MKLTSIYCASPNYDLGLKNINKTMYKVFEELDVTINEINIYDLSLPFFDGETLNVIDEIINEIDSADGIIFSYTSSFNGPSSIMKNLIDHIGHNYNKNFLREKNCLQLTITNDNCPKASLRYFSDIINKYKGFDSVSIGLTEELGKSISYETNNRDIFEKQIEDYYRIIRQNRKYFLYTKENTSFQRPIIDLEDTSLNFKTNGSIEEVIKTKIKTIKIDIPKHDDSLDNSTNIKDNIIKDMKEDNIILNNKNISAEEISQQLNLDSLSKNQKEDVEEISNFFATKFKPGKGGVIIEEEEKFYFDNISDDTVVNPKNRTTKQITQILPHYYKPPTNENIEFIMQLKIDGDEGFHGYLLIDNSTCKYFDGDSEDPDIILLSDEKVWRNIITGKITSQKSFMTGLLKVKGNFILLTKFDQIFDNVM